MHNLQEKAIEATLKGDFQKANKLNMFIIKNNSYDLDAYLRLGFAHLQMSNFRKARLYYQKALKLQNHNLIAQTNLEKIAILEKRGKSRLDKKTSLSFDPNLFLNVVGKTKATALINLGNISILAKLKIGQRMYIKIKKRRVEIRTENNEYIGALPDDISKRLIFFIEAKSIYHTYIKEVSKNQVDIFLKEEQKGKKVATYVSFPRNIQEDLKSMGITENTNDEEQHDDEKQNLEKDRSEDDDESTKETPIDIEALAEQIDEKEEFTENNQFEEEKDDFEE
ncbi:MAG TPA: hypothetical protein VJB63_03510 [Patescibacteria group bacterium]|nr:hypothetical protein [Patescibacteria group bacterium]